jgi:hypothetical protein
MFKILKHRTFKLNRSALLKLLHRIGFVRKPLRTFRSDALALAVALFATPVFAAQQLLPEPYPGQRGGNAQESQPVNPTLGAPQELVPEPAPQAKGPDALDDPRPVTARRHQHLIRTPYLRQDWCNGTSACTILR